MTEKNIEEFVQSESEYLMDLDWDEKLKETSETREYVDPKTGLTLIAEIATITFTPSHPELSVKVERIQINDTDANVQSYLNRAKSKVTNEWLTELGMDNKKYWIDQNTKKIYRPREVNYAV